MIEAQWFDILIEFRKYQEVFHEVEVEHQFQHNDWLCFEDILLEKKQTQIYQMWFNDMWMKQLLKKKSGHNQKYKVIYKKSDLFHKEKHHYGAFFLTDSI